MFKFLGNFGKGWGTIAGVAGVVLGAVTGGSHDVSSAIGTLTDSVPATVTAVGAILAAFGIGRKAGAAIKP